MNAGESLYQAMVDASLAALVDAMGCEGGFLVVVGDREAYATTVTGKRLLPAQLAKVLRAAADSCDLHGEAVMATGHVQARATVKI